MKRRVPAEVSKFFEKFGREGGQSTSAAKVAAAQKNGRKGGRPKGSKNKPKEVK